MREHGRLSEGLVYLGIGLALISFALWIVWRGPVGPNEDTPLRMWAAYAFSILGAPFLLAGLWFILRR